MRALFYPSDPTRLKVWIKKLQDEGFYVDRCNIHQLKCLDVSFYWNRGTIVCDPHHTQQEKGFEAFLVMLHQRGGRTIKIGM